ncbi:MAG TPA: class I SAM-dependent methyltransferase [bacterium]|nr:class I SAM-dependent methyltransferase [bacterium]
MPEINPERKKDEFWKRHFEYYDFFQQQFSWYQQTIKFHLAQMEGCERILDTGAGSGNLTKELLEKSHRVVAIDSEKYALEQLREKTKEIGKNLEIVTNDVCQMGFADNSFDGVTSMFLLPFIKDAEAYLREVYRILKNGGKFSISAWAPEPDIFKRIKEKIEEELTQKNILPQKQLMWEEFLKTSAINATNVKESGLTKDKILGMLKTLKFVDSQEFVDVAYEKYAYFITCNK